MLASPISAQSLVDFDGSDWNGGTGFTYSMNDVADPVDHANALPYVAQEGTFGGVGVDLTYEHSNAYGQGIIGNDYVSNSTELNTYSGSNGGLIRFAADSDIDTFGNNDGYTTLTFAFDQDVLVSDFVLGSLDSLYRITLGGTHRINRDYFQVRAYDSSNNLVDPSSQNLNFFSVADGDAIATDEGASGWQFTAQDASAPSGPGESNLSVHAVGLDWEAEAIRSLEVTIYGTQQANPPTGFVIDPSISGGFSGALTGFQIQAVPEPSGTLLCGLASLSFLLRRKRLG